MLPPEYGHRPTWELPRQPSGDADQAPLFMAVGKALSQWEELGTELSQLFAALVASESAAAMRAYGTVASAQGRYDLLDSAAEVYFSERDQDVYERYKHLPKSLRYASPRRNDIAHGVVREYASPDVAGGGSCLVSPDYNSRRTKAFIDFSTDSLDPFDFARHRYAYTSAQLTELRERFAVLTPETGNFVRLLRRKAHRLPSEPPAS
jgi:hypothetical protein